MINEQIIEADWTWTGEKFEPEVQVVVDDDGWIRHVGALGEKPTQRLSNQALLPGFVSAHSHAFQRGLRGLGETFPDGAGSFWTWREAMYQLVNEMTPDRMYSLCHQAFGEMLAAGITCVGEFHYLHHDQSLEGFSLDEAVLRAAKDTGIRIALLQTYYHTGGINQPIEKTQRRFYTTSLDAFWKQVDRLTPLLDPATQSMGIAAHSIRAVSVADMKLLRAEAQRRDLVFHFHIEEQRQEIADCKAHCNTTPMRQLVDQVGVDDQCTAVHGTHTDDADMQAYGGAKGTVCLCPLTEANLGDGVPNLAGMLASGARICIGTDSNARLCMTEELRWLEYVQRLSTERRGCAINPAGQVSATLLEMATINGANSLGIETGLIEPGRWADFLAVDLNTAGLSGWTSETLLDAFILGTGNEAIVATCVGGHWRTNVAAKGYAAH